MPSFSIPGPTFERLVERAAALNISVEELVTPVLNQLAAGGPAPRPPSHDWQTIGSYRAKISGGEIVFTDTNSSSGLRFYRIEKVPCYCK